MSKKRQPIVSSELTPELLRHNAILAGLDPAQAAFVTERAVVRQLRLRDSIYQPDEPIREVYFPIDCVLSIVTRMRDGSQVEVGTVGREGLSALPILFGAVTTANESYCQVPGTAVRMPLAAFNVLKEDPRFRQLLDRYVQAYVNMLGQLAACNRLHSVYERCARWLLMTRDRVAADDIPLTHEYLAMMLGTQRSGVTLAAGILRKAGFIDYRGGVITIVDRASLIDAACECYHVAEEQFGGLLRATIVGQTKP